MAATRSLLIDRSATGPVGTATARRPATPTPSLPYKRVGMESVVQPRPLQGFSIAANRGLLEYRPQVRPSSPIEATVEREKVDIGRSFLEPSDGLEPSTPSLPSLCSIAAPRPNVRSVAGFTLPD